MFEAVFNCITDYRLRELTDHDAPLMRELKDRAMGTFNHSIVVAHLAEACAIALDEDTALARAAAYYHDVGKLRQPEYFTENQAGYNPHNELSPELSVDIIRSHAKDGYDLIRSKHLPKLLADVAIQHHGTMPIKYFYAKALKMTDGELNIEDFSYPGPKPQTKVAAIIMISDASEGDLANAARPLARKGGERRARRHRGAHGSRPVRRVRHHDEGFDGHQGNDRQLPDGRVPQPHPVSEAEIETKGRNGVEGR